MNQNFANKVKVPNCSKCGCEDRFIHHLWDEQKRFNACTSCVLFTYIKLYCPTCFELIVDPDREVLIRCSNCFSYSHAGCVSTDDKPFKCPTCEDPERLVFNFHEYSKPKEDGGCSKLMDSKKTRLLLTAAQLVNKLVSEAYVNSVRAAVIHATEAVSAKKKTRAWVERFMKFEESNAGPSLLDCSPETSRETPRAFNEEE